MSKEDTISEKPCGHGMMEEHLSGTRLLPFPSSPQPHATEEQKPSPLLSLNPMHTSQPHFSYEALPPTSLSTTIILACTTGLADHPESVKIGNNSNKDS